VSSADADFAGSGALQLLFVISDKLGAICKAERSSYTIKQKMRKAKYAFLTGFPQPPKQSLCCSDADAKISTRETSGGSTTRRC
jgi:hypothetical protein